MSAVELLSNLQARGVCLSVRDGALKVKAPVDTLTAAERTELAACKSELLAILTASEAKPETKRAHSVRSRSGQLAACLFDNCGGKANRVGVDIWQCAACGERFQVARFTTEDVELFDKWIH